MIPLRLGNKPHKYRAKPMVFDGHRFDSTAEAKYYAELKLRERAGELSEIEVHPEFSVNINGIHVCMVVIDFAYLDCHRRKHFIDVKGIDTPLSKLKRKLIFAVHDINVEIVR